MKVCMSCGGRVIEASEPRPRIECQDGTTLSVQVGSSLYCTPRTNSGPWTHVEVGFLDVAPPDTWKEYADDVSSETPDVYGYVPVRLVEEYIAAHGGRKVWV